MVIWSIWEEISRVMAILCLVTAGAAFVAAGILLVREELTGRLLETLKTETGRRKGILVLAAAGVWILVIGHGVSAAEVPQAERTASTAAGSLAGTSAAGSKVEAAAGETKAGAAGAKQAQRRKPMQARRKREQQAQRRKPMQAMWKREQQA